jgi:hypothetical protein
MKKIKSPWYALIWIVVWTAALVWFLLSGMFDQRESVALVLVWFVMVGITAYFLIGHLKRDMRVPRSVPAPGPALPSLNAACPCGSGIKYKRCCGQSKS